MKKTIFTVAFIILSLFFSFSYVLATDDAVNTIRNGVGTAENVVEDAVQNTAGAIKNGFNTIGDKTEQMMNGVTNNNMDDNNNTSNDNMMNDDIMGNTSTSTNYTATRTSTDASSNANTENPNGIFNNTWTWVIVGIIVIALIALIWYYVGQNNR